MIRHPILKVIALLWFAFCNLENVDAHGYVQTPRSRQWVAAEVREQFLKRYLSIKP